MLKSDKIVVGDGSDGVFILRARHACIHKLGAHGFKLRLGLGHVHRGGHAAGKAPLGQVELPFQVGDRVREQLDLRIEAAQGKVVGSHLGVERETHVGCIGGAGLRVLARLLHGAADAAPEIRLPTGLTGDHEIAVGGGAAGRGQRPVGRNAVAADRGARGERGIEVGADRASPGPARPDRSPAPAATAHCWCRCALPGG